MVASHNADTVRYGVKRMAELDLDPMERVLCFAQLLGMCDQITFPLGEWPLTTPGDRKKHPNTLIQVKAATACINMSPTVLSMRCCHTCLGGKNVPPVSCWSYFSHSFQGKWKRKYVGQSFTGEEAVENRVDQKNHERTTFLQSSGILQASWPLNTINNLNL